MKTLRITIEADHEETQLTPIRSAVAEFVTRLPNMGFQHPRVDIDFDAGPQPEPAEREQPTAG